VAGKTGTSNEERDAWFIGFTPDLTVGVYVGYDSPRPMGKGRTGGELAAPIVADFMKMALRDKPATPFRVPKGVELIPINVKTGQRDLFGETNVILEAFKPGDEPAESAKIIGEQASVVGGQGNGARPAASEAGKNPDIDGGLTTGTGGLYSRPMRTEISNLVDEMKQSIGLLRRHL
jgi:penicillin-binding protein 1A